MQTFVPCLTFEGSARVLDYRRLGKQRVEAMQILNTLTHGGGWSNHPAVQMWKGHEVALQQYMRAMILEWVDRGYNNTMEIPRKRKYTLPSWWGGKIHLSHRKALLHKDYDHYRQYFRGKPELNYYWPGDEEGS